MFHNRVLREALASYPIVGVYVLTQAKGVDLPRAVLESGEVTRLDVGLRLAKPILNLHVGETELTGVFSFEGQPYLVRVPWSAVPVIGVEGEFETRFKVEIPAKAQTRPGLRLVH